MIISNFITPFLGLFVIKIYIIEKIIIITALHSHSFIVYQNSFRFFSPNRKLESLILLLSIKRAAHFPQKYFYTILKFKTNTYQPKFPRSIFTQYSSQTLILIN